MNRKHRFLFVFVVLALLVMLPSAAFASKQVWKARLTTSAELHDVVNSSAAGSLLVGTNPDGSPRFTLFVHDLSGPATAAHIHGPADETQNASPVVTLCGNGPTAPVVATCTMDASGNLMIEGDIRGANLAAGVTGAQLFDWLDNGLLYVNVHTALNPAGEARGQIYPR